jgi:S1-C subfamily serine protease
MAKRVAARTSCGLLAASLAAVFAHCVARAADLADVIEQVEPSVVRIDTDRAIGSGAVVDADGLLITNYHVIAGAKRATVTFRSGTTAKVIGYLVIEPTHDLALLKIKKPAQALSAISILDKMPRKGEKVAAFGTPQGLSFTTSEGIISAIRSGGELSRLVGAEAYKAQGYATIPFKLSFAALGDESGGGDVRRVTATFG